MGDWWALREDEDRELGSDGERKGGRSRIGRLRWPPFCGASDRLGGPLHVKSSRAQSGAEQRRRKSGR